MILCVPPIDSCGHQSEEGHHCCRSMNHDPQLRHGCFCGERWGVDVELEAAMRCYIEFYTIPYTEEPDLPPPGAVLAACAPLNSKWRKMVRIAHRKPIDVPLESL